MKPFLNFAAPMFTRVALSALCFISFGYSQLKASPFNTCLNEQDTIESKVDYIEQIYFSGDDKNGINARIAVALQQIMKSQETPALVTQFKFLLDISQKAEAEESTCDILELLAAGMYEIDAATAFKDGVKKPSAVAKAKAGSALQSLGKFGSAASNVSSSAGAAAWSSYLTKGGSSGFSSGASKLSNTAGNVGNVANTVGATAQAAGQAKELIGGLGFGKGKKEKACKDVAKKDIAIGPHTAASAVQTAVAKETPKEAPKEPLYKTTMVSVKGIDYDRLKNFEESIKACACVQFTSKKFNTAASTIEVHHSGTTDELFTMMKQTSKTICISKNIETVEDGKIGLKL